MSLVTLRSYRDPIAAEVAKSRLEGEGIRAAIFDDHLVNVYWLYSHAIGGVKVKVEASDLERAREVLAEDRSDDLLAVSGGPDRVEPGDTCPECGSRALHRSGLQRNVAAFTLLTGIPFLLWRRRWVCESCGHTWKPEPAREATAPETLAAEDRVREGRSYPIKRVIFAVFLGLAILRYVEYQIRGY